MVIEPEGAQTKAVYASSFYKDTPAVTVNHLGQGKAYYVGTTSTYDFYETLLSEIVEEKQLKSTDIIGEGLDIIERVSDTHRVVFIMNHAHHELTVQINHAYTNLLTGEMVEGAFVIPPKDLMIVSCSNN